MAWIQINTRPTRRQLVVFGLAWLVFFAFVGWLIWSQTGLPALGCVLWGAAAMVPAAGCAVPGLMRGVYVAMSYVTFPIGYAVSILVLATIYYLVLTPTGLIMRLFGRDPMTRRFEPETQTYWVTHEQKDDPQSYLRQF